MGSYRIKRGVSRPAGSKASGTWRVEFTAEYTDSFALHSGYSKIENNAILIMESCAAGFCRFIGMWWHSDVKNRMQFLHVKAYGIPDEETADAIMVELVLAGCQQVTKERE